MMLMGKNVPERNIIGNVTTFPITPAVSGFFVMVPTSMPNEQNIIGPRIRKGISQTVNVMLRAKQEDSYGNHEYEAEDSQGNVPHYFRG